MSRDPTLITPFNYAATANYGPALAQFLQDSCGIGFHLKLPIGFATANSAVLFTVPTGMKVEIDQCYWEIGTSFTGGASSSLGVSSSNTAYNTAGDLLGGSAGDVAAVMISTGSPYKGTVGAKLAKAVNGTTACVVLVAADTIILNRITSIYTAGAGFVHVSGNVMVD